MPQPSWVTKAEKETGRKWEDIDPFYQLQYQLADPKGYIIYHTPVIPRWEGSLLSKQPKRGRKSW